jgi:selenocysteine lyase/cysteine desulfurase
MSAAARGRGVPIMLDGAHVVGGLDLDVPSLGADFYTANCHKWLCAPKGVAFLWVRREMQARVRPTVISHGARARALVVCVYVGGRGWWGGRRRRRRRRRRRKTGWAVCSVGRLWNWLHSGIPVGCNRRLLWVSLCSDRNPRVRVAGPARLGSLAYAHTPGTRRCRCRYEAMGPERVRAYCHALVTSAAAALAARWGTTVLTPPACVSTLSAVFLPPGRFGARDGDALHRALRARGIEVPISCVGGRLVVRIAAQVYNNDDDYARLADAITELQGEAV